MIIRRKRSISGNRFFVGLLSIYFILLLIVIYLACLFSYEQKKVALMAQINSTYAQLRQEYNNITDNFWQVYMPIYESNTNVLDILTRYFSNDTSLTPFDKLDVGDAARQLMIRDNDIQWLVLYNPNRSVNYILYNNGTSLQPLPTNFPYYTELNSSPRTMEIYGMKPLSSGTTTYYTFAISSGISSSMGTGKIMVGYSTASMKKICTNTSTGLESLNFVVTNNGNILFDSSGKYDPLKTFCPTDEINEIVTVTNGQKLFVKSQASGLNTSIASYNVSWHEFFFSCHEFTPLMVALAITFAIVSVIGYLTMLRMINREVTVIRDGLNQIGENHLEYQIPTRFNQSGLPEIADSINHMTIRLKENINRAYYYELRQKEAELSELQSKFNPHFLYNTLEMLRSRCSQHGDDSTADLITQLAAIFRGFISSRNFIPMTEELALSKRYLALFGARYEDKVTIRFDFDKEILRYGIIRNLFQPLIENYFVHGFDTSNEENYILFKGKSLDEQTILLTVEDNGSGMSLEEMEELNTRLHEPIQIDTESYGLKNLHQRLQLFYGGDCGLTIYPNPNENKGLSIQMTALKMTCEEYEVRKKFGSR